MQNTFPRNPARGIAGALVHVDKHTAITKQALEPLDFGMVCSWSDGTRKKVSLFNSNSDEVAGVVMHQLKEPSVDGNLSRFETDEIVGVLREGSIFCILDETVTDLSNHTVHVRFNTGGSGQGSVGVTAGADRVSVGSKLELMNTGSIGDIVEVRVKL